MRVLSYLTAPPRGSNLPPPVAECKRLCAGGPRATTATFLPQLALVANALAKLCGAGSTRENNWESAALTRLRSQLALPSQSNLCWCAQAVPPVLLGSTSCDGRLPFTTNAPATQDAFATYHSWPRGWLLCVACNPTPRQRRRHCGSEPLLCTLRHVSSGL